jgi:hypothetical protein
LIGLLIGLVVGAGIVSCCGRRGVAAAAHRGCRRRRERADGCGGGEAEEEAAAPAGVPAQPGETEFEETEPAPLTAGDRALEWRGDNVVAPPSRIDLSAGAEARPLEDSEINSTVGSQTGGVRECVVQGATGTDLRATITIKLLVDGNGRVTKSQLRAPRYLFEKGLLGCAQRALGRMKFPSSGAPTMVTFPVNLG